MYIGRAESRTGEQRKVSDRWRCTDGSVVLRFSGGFYGERHKWFNSGDVPQRFLCGYVTGVPHRRSTEQRSAQSMTNGGAQTAQRFPWGKHGGGVCSPGPRSVGHLQCTMRRFSPTAGDASQQLVIPPPTPPPA